MNDEDFDDAHIESYGTHKKGEDDDEDMPESEKIKQNLKNSSNVYYSITHTV